jgi:hypothetical protein
MGQQRFSQTGAASKPGAILQDIFFIRHWIYMMGSTESSGTPRIYK